MALDVVRALCAAIHYCAGLRYLAVPDNGIIVENMNTVTTF